MAIEIAGLADIVHAHAAERPETAALVHRSDTTSYGVLDRAAMGPIAEDIKPQARVGHLDKSCDLFFEFLFGHCVADVAVIGVPDER
jgi:hypothetical protein